MQTKNDLRKYYKAKRQSLSIEQIETFDKQIANNFKKLDLPPIVAFLSYEPIKKFKEPNVSLITAFLKEIHPNIILATPKVIGTGPNMEGIIIDNNNTIFESSIYGIPEPTNGHIIDPKNLDLIITPLLTFDKKGNRLGYGKGMYDRYFILCKPDVIKIGISYFEPQESLPELNPHDITLDYCITPENVYQFN